MQKQQKKIPTEKPTIFKSPFHIELDSTPRGFSISLSGVKGISEYSDSKIKLRLSGFSLLISGEKMFMTVFEERRVEIIGKFKEVEFIYGKA